MPEPFHSWSPRPFRADPARSTVAVALLCLVAVAGGWSPDARAWTSEARKEARDTTPDASERIDGSNERSDGPKGKAAGERSERDAGPASIADLERDLRAPKPETRRAAVKKLAECDERKAWDLVVLALADRESMVADEAQFALGGARDRKLVADLLGSAGLRAKDPWVRLRVAESFGRMSVEIDAEALARAIPGGRDPESTELARTLIWTIERLATVKRLGGDRRKAWRAVEDVAKSRASAELRGAALVALNALDALEAHALVVEGLADREGAVRCAALLAVATFPEQECLTRSVAALADVDLRVRTQAVENVERLGSRASILALIHQMEIEKRERLRYRILAYLRRRSGLELGFDGPAWRGWAEKLESGRLATGERRRDLGESLPGTKASLAGLSLLSDRVCFVIDFSGSTWGTKVGEKTRKQILDEKLRAALEALPEGTQFNVMPFTNEPIPWEKALVPSTKANVKRALDWFERCHKSGRGNFYDAALLALSDPDVDTIVALTDGVPTGGRRWHMELMIDLFVERDRFRKVAFDSVLVDAPYGRRKQWEELAERTGGRSVTADME